jgi:hypothetical protein
VRRDDGARWAGAERAEIGPSTGSPTSAALMWAECNPTAGAGLSGACQARVKLPASGMSCRRRARAAVLEVVLRESSLPLGSAGYRRIRDPHIRGNRTQTPAARHTSATLASARCSLLHRVETHADPRMAIRQTVLLRQLDARVTPPERLTPGGGGVGQRSGCPS